MAPEDLVVEEIREDLFRLRAPSFMWPATAAVYVITGPDGFFMIDAGCGNGDAPERLKAGLSARGLDLSTLKTLVLSHAHPDHMGASRAILDQSSPTVLIHTADADHARDPRGLIETFDIELAKRLYGRAEGPVADLFSFFDGSGCSMSSADPDGVLEEGDVVGLGAYRFEVLHTPGHSPGHISLFDRKTGILFGGDLVGDVVAWYTPGAGGVTGYLDSLEKIERCAARLILPSHGAVIDDPAGKIGNVRERLLARERKMLDIISGGEISFFDLVCRMFPNEMVRFFPGTGITESHVQKLAAEGRIIRDGMKIRIA